MSENKLKFTFLGGFLFFLGQFMWKISDFLDKLGFKLVMKARKDAKRVEISTYDEGN